MQGARDQFLAGAGFAGDEHRQGRLREPADGAEQFAHRRRLADQLRSRGQSAFSAFGKSTLTPFRLRQGARRQRDRFVEVEGLGQELVRAAAKSAGRAGDIGIGRHHDNRQLRSLRLERIEKAESVEAGHAHVGEHQRRRGLRFERLQRGARAVVRLHAIAGLAQRFAEHIAHGAVVVDDPDPLGFRHRSLPLRPGRSPAATR